MYRSGGSQPSSLSTSSSWGLWHLRYSREFPTHQCAGRVSSGFSPGLQCKRRNARTKGQPTRRKGLGHESIHPHESRCSPQALKATSNTPTLQDPFEKMVSMEIKDPKNQVGESCAAARPTALQLNELRADGFRACSRRQNWIRWMKRRNISSGGPRHLWASTQLLRLPL